MKLVAEIKSLLNHKTLLSFLVLDLLILFLGLSLTSFNTHLEFPYTKAANNGCYLPCNINYDCQNGLVCGKDWCPEGKNCEKYFRCFQPRCPQNRLCDCF